MTLKQVAAFRDGELARQLIRRMASFRKRPIRLMEVCGTHTVAIFRSGIRTVLPDDITLLSGPGCPVCVTAQGEIDAFIALARMENTIITTFGDLMRVPGSGSSLRKEKAAGRDIRMVYSTLDALEIARRHPRQRIVFLGVGFETTAPTVAAAVLGARQMKLDNFFVFSAHKRVPPALEALMALEDVAIDGFILPGHVSVIIGLDAYRLFFENHRVPSVVAGFEPVDILQGVVMLLEQMESGMPALANAYTRAVTPEGNPRARETMEAVFETADANWRGIGIIPGSGLKIRPSFSAFDAEKAFAVQVADIPEPAGCACGEILTGAKTPPECPLFRNPCTPAEPVGPCMVSSEGTCAAYHRYDP